MKSQDKSQPVLPSDSLVPLESVLCTEELNQRPSRPPDYETENRALVYLAQALADSPRSILQTLADKILEVFHADSAGISLLTKEDGGKRFYWPAIAGVWNPHIGGGTPRDFGPCGDVLDRNTALLFRHFERRYAYFLPVTPPVEECLLVPFYVEGKAVGTIWAIAHDERRKFDAEDRRQLESLGRFASAAYQAVEFLAALEQREGALRQRNAELAQRMAELQKRTAQYETLLNQAPLGVYLVDSNLRIQQVNPIARPAFAGIPDLIGRTLDEVMHLLWTKEYADELVGIFRRTLETGESYETPESIQYRIDRRVTEYYEWRIDRIQLPEGGYGVVCYFRDIAAQVLARAAIAESQERLRQAAKMEAIGRLAGGLAHDFNNQLHALRGYAGNAARDMGIGAQTKEDLLEVQRAADCMADLTRQLLAFSRQQVLQPVILDLDQAIADGQELLQRLIGSQIEFRIERGTGAKWVRADRTQLQQVLMNLCINARDAMPDGGRLEVRTSVRTVASAEAVPNGDALIPAGEYAELVVADSGTGISSEDLPHIFEPFFTTKEVGKGTGLGLATTHGIVAQSQGHIYVETAPEYGTRFTVLLPLTFEPPDQAAQKPRAAHRPRILVVEDKDPVRRLLARTLQDEGYEVVEARHGREALARLEEQDARIELVLTDVIMPVMGGKELGQRLAAERPSLPLVWISGYPRDTAFVGGHVGTQQPFLQKPVVPEVLIETVRNVLKWSPALSVASPSGSR